MHVHYYPVAGGRHCQLIGDENVVLAEWHECCDPHCKCDGLVEYWADVELNYSFIKSLPYCRDIYYSRACRKMEHKQ